LSNKSETRELEERIGYRFSDPKLLMQALTHSSQTAGRGADSERLEFLGDRVLGLVIAQFVVERHPDASVGSIATRYNALVNRSSCARVAEMIQLGKLLRLGKSVPAPSGNPGAGVLADAMEALIASVYLDGGLEEARRLILRFWSGPEFERLGDGDDPKSRLQVWAQARQMRIPDYRVTERTGPAHKPSFTVDVELETGISASAQASSKKLAERRAASKLLDMLDAGDD